MKGWDFGYNDFYELFDCEFFDLILVGVFLCILF